MLFEYPCALHDYRKYCKVSHWDISVVHMQTFGEKFEAAINKQIVVELVERDMDQKTLAEAIGIERATLSRYLTGKRSIPMPTFIKIAEALKVSPQMLMQRAEARIQPESETA